MIPKRSLRRALAVSAALHLVAAIVAWLVVPPTTHSTDLLEIEIAPPAPLAEALPPELDRPRQPTAPESEPERTQDETAPAATHTDPSPDGEAPRDAGVDAMPDAAVDARPDAAVDARPDAAVDAGVPDTAEAAPDALPDAVTDAVTDAGVDAALVASEDSDAGVPDAGDAGAVAVAVDDAGIPDAGDDAAQIAASGSAGSGEPPGPTRDPAHGADAAGSASGTAIAPGSGADSAVRVPLDEQREAMGGGDPTGSAGGAGGKAPRGIDTKALAAELGAASATPGTGDAPAVEGAPTTAGTAANLLTYFPDGHIVTALIRLDRLRGTEWAGQTERLLKPMPDYQVLFGAHDAAITDKLDTLVISTPRPRDASATTLVAHTSLARPALRELLASGAPVTWSTTRGGLLGKRRGPADPRVFLSPFQGWFLLAQPGDLGGLTRPAPGALDSIVATGALPPWLAGIRTIERETGDPRGPALVLTLGLDEAPTGAAGGAASRAPKRLELGNDFGLGVSDLPIPERASLAAELVPQGWLVRGNLRFASDALAAEFVASVQSVQHRVVTSRIVQLAVGKPAVRLVANFAFARNGPRVSYATSISIADARRLLAIAAQQLDRYFGRAP